jgi:molybdopterin-containing oxidoreductase family membrane subunit
VWDAFAVSTYATVSLLFWYVGLIPDVATLRDRAKAPFAKWIYGFLAMGWRGSARHWARYRTAYMLMAAIATPLVVSVHTIVSWDFAVAILPGWHSTIFPPYFVAGAIYSGFAMVLTLAIPLRKFYNLTDFITDKHLDNMGKVLVATGMIVTFGYAMEAFMGWYGDSKFEQFLMLKERPFGDYWKTYWMLILCNCCAVQLLWFKGLRRNVLLLWIISLIINQGMWLERYIIVVTSLHTDYLPSSWNIYGGTFWDYATLFGSMGLFLTMLFLFVRFLPVISIAEMRELVQEGREEEAHSS